MSLPRADYDPRRVCLNPFPNFTLGKHKRTVGVYLAGALVSHNKNKRSFTQIAHPTPALSFYQFALANWTFLDAAILSAHAKDIHPTRPPLVHVSFVDWVPGICSLLGMIVVNMIDKDRVRGDEGYGDSRAVWRARLFLFIGFALMAGGLAGSVVRLFSFDPWGVVTDRLDAQTVLVLKYIMNDYPEQYNYYGYCNVSQNIALMLSAVVLWISQSTGGEYEYSLTI
jgi:hypothetical protein